jgi:hypothetical protein
VPIHAFNRCSADFGCEHRDWLQANNFPSIRLGRDGILSRQLRAGGRRGLFELNGDAQIRGICLFRSDDATLLSRTCRGVGQEDFLADNHFNSSNKQSAMSIDDLRFSSLICDASVGGLGHWPNSLTLIAKKKQVIGVLFLGTLSIERVLH